MCCANSCDFLSGRQLLPAAFAANSWHISIRWTLRTRTRAKQKSYVGSGPFNTRAPYFHTEFEEVNRLFPKRLTSLNWVRELCVFCRGAFDQCAEDWNINRRIATGMECHVVVLLFSYLLNIIWFWNLDVRFSRRNVTLSDWIFALSLLFQLKFHCSQQNAMYRRHRWESFKLYRFFYPTNSIYWMMMTILAMCSPLARRYRYQSMMTWKTEFTQFMHFDQMKNEAIKWWQFTCC